MNLHKDLMRPLRSFGPRYDPYLALYRPHFIPIFPSLFLALIFIKARFPISYISSFAQTNALSAVESSAYRLPG